MGKRYLLAGAAVAAFSQIAKAEPIPDFADTVTPETAYAVLDQSQACLLASEALNPPTNALLSPVQSQISIIAKTITQSELGEVVTRQNAANNVFYCQFDMTLTDGLFIPKINTAIISTYTSFPMATATEEFTHGYQSHTNPYLINSDNFTKYGAYVSYLAAEAQAKLWAEKILYDVAIDQRIPEEFLAMSPVNFTSRNCIERDQGDVDLDCMEQAFTTIFSSDNLYTEFIMQQVKGRAQRNDLQSEYEVCGTFFAESFGYIHHEGQKKFFLNSIEHNPHRLLNFDKGERPLDSQFLSWANPLALMLMDDSVTMEQGLPRFHRQLPCFENK